MSKTKIYEKIELTIIALCIIFVISIISDNKEIPMLTSANYEKTIGWGIKRENNHLQPDVGSKNKQILEENNGICMGRDGEKIIYLTFDSGYEAGYMDKILTTLKENNVKATFFITAHYLNSATEEVEKMVNDGHIIGNHTVNHKSMPSINNETIEKEIMQLHQSMYEKFGYEMKYLRPPKGEFNERTLQKTSSLGYKTVMWSFAYCDWDEKKQPSQEEAIKIITKNFHSGEIMLLHSNSKTNSEVLDKIIKEAKNQGYEFKSLDELDAIGHRVVHGGEQFKDAVLITDEVIQEIKENAMLAPLHNPAAILGIEACQKVVPNKPMVAVFDTAFHQTISKEKYIYPIPYEYYEKYHVRKYGFHGTSHQYVANRVAEILGKDIKELKIVNCHLGQGASICAIKNGESVETSMGLTPLGGIPMGTRSGDLDPSVVTYLMKKEELDADDVEEVLNRESGVYGISMVSVDFRDIEAEALAGGKHAKLALDAYHYSIAGYIAKCAVAMGGIDVLTFTAGVGEKSPYSRSEICKQLGIFGVEISGKANLVKGEEAEISSPNSKVKVFVIPTNEELMIAQETAKLVK